MAWFKKEFTSANEAYRFTDSAQTIFMNIDIDRARKGIARPDGGHVLASGYAYWPQHDLPVPRG